MDVLKGHVDQAKRSAGESRDEVKSWGRSGKDQASDSWEGAKQWGQGAGQEVEGKVNSAARNGPGKNDLLVDLGHPLINRVVDGLVKVGGVGALHAASQDGYKVLMSGDTNSKTLEKSAQRVGKEAVQWGLVAGVYSGVTYGIEEARGVQDWKNALLGGLLTGAALSLTEANAGGDRVVRGALTGGAIATAAEIMRNIS